MSDPLPLTPLPLSLNGARGGYFAVLSLAPSRESVAAGQLRGILLSAEASV